MIVIACIDCRRRLKFNTLRNNKINAQGDHALSCNKCGSANIVAQVKAAHKAAA